MSFPTLSFKLSKSNRQHSKSSVQPICTTLSSLSDSQLCRSQRVDKSIHLSTHRKAEMLALMRDVEREVVNSMIGNHEMMTIWTPRMRKKGIDYYVDDTVAKGFARFCCVGQTDASVIDMMPMFVSTHSKTMLKNARIMNEKVKEAKILSVLQPATGSHPYKSVYIRYTSMDTPKLIYGRDICVCVCTDVIKTRDGSTVGYCLWNSVDMPECPDRFDTDKVVRSKVWNSGFIFRNSGKLNAMTKVCFIVGIELSCVAPQITSRIYMTIFGGSCSRVCQYYRKRFIDPENFKHRAEWISKHETHDCYVCSRLFNPFIKKYNCMRCGEVICKRCFFMEEISVRGAKVIRVRICHYCLEDKGMLAWHLRAIATHDSHHCLTCNGAGVKDLLRHGSVEASQLYIKNNS